MESRIYEEKFKELKDSINNLLKNKNNKAKDYQKRTFEEYYNALDEGDFSPKNFKSKVTYFTNQKEKYYDEINTLVLDTNRMVKEFLDEIMTQMEAEKDSLQIQERRNDLLALNSTIKRLRQDNANKMSAYDKEYQNRIKEMQSLISEKEKDYQAYSSEVIKKLNIEIQKIIEAYDEKINPLERSLLTTDEKEKIDEIKEKIKELRLKMIDEEEKIEIGLNDKQRIDNNLNYQSIIDNKMELEKTLEEYSLLKSENSRNNSLLSIDSEVNIFNYDINKRDEGFDLINEIYRRKVEYFYLIRDQKRSGYTRELNLKKKYNDKMFLYASINPIHPFIKLIDFLLNEFDGFAKYFNKEIEAVNSFKQAQITKLSEKIFSLDLSLFQGKSKERKLFEDQTRKDAIKLLDSDLLNDEYGLIIDLFEKILNLFPLNNSSLDKKDRYLNNIYLTERNLNKYDSLEKFESYMSFMEVEFGRYRERYLNNKNNEINHFNDYRVNKITKINQKYLDSMNDINNNYIKLNEELYHLLIKEKEKINQEYFVIKEKIENNYKERRLTI